MHILFTHLRSIGGVNGGLEKVLCGFANAMARRGHQVVVAIYDDSGKPPFYSLDPGVRLVNLYPSGGEPRRLSAARKLSRELARLRGQVEAWYEAYRDPFILPQLEKLYRDFVPDVILNQYYTSSGFLYASHPPCPVVQMLHNEPERILSRCSARERKGMAESALVQVLLPGFVSYVKGQLPHTPCICIPNTVPEVADGETADLSAEKKTYRIIHVGRLDRKHKQQHLLIEAFARLAGSFPSWEVDFYGEGDAAYKKELLSLITSSHLEGQVFLRGATHDVFARYRESDIFAFPSSYEGFPLALTEAMSAGLPPVAFRACTACQDLVADGEDGLLTADGAEALAAGLRRLMEDRALRVRLGQHAHESMKQYAPQKIWDRWETVLSSVAEGAPAGREVK